MAINIAPKSLDTELSELMREVSTGKEQLPEFQRGWTWDNDRIRGIIASLSQGYPMGAIMRLEYGNENVRFKYRTIEGVTATGVTPEQCQQLKRYWHLPRIKNQIEYLGQNTLR